MKQSIAILGARGSVPVGGEACLRYGGATSCVAVHLAGQTLVLDAGTGLLSFAKLRSEERVIHLLLSHPHADHLLGFSLCPIILDARNHLHIYAAPRGGRSAEEQLRALMSPPLWPVTANELPATFSFHDLPNHFSIGEVTVDTMEGVHPGGVSLLRLSGGGRSVVYATDCTLTEELLPRLTEFARDCDLLLCDGQYRDEEWGGRQNFGHSTWTAAAQLGLACGAKNVRIIHHDPFRSDDELDAGIPLLQSIHPRCTFAREGEEIEL